MIKGIRLKIGALAAVGIAAASGVAQAGGHMVDVELTKLDGTKMTRTYEKPRYVSPSWTGLAAQAVQAITRTS